MDSTFFIRRGAHVSSGVNAQTLQQMAVTGTLLPSDEISQDGTNWVQAMTVRGLNFSEGAAEVSTARPFDVFISYSKFNIWYAFNTISKMVFLMKVILL